MNNAIQSLNKLATVIIFPKMVAKQYLKKSPLLLEVMSVFNNLTLLFLHNIIDSLSI